MDTSVVDATSVNVSSHLRRMAKTHPDRVAIYFPRYGVNPTGTTRYQTLTFRQLDLHSDAVAYGLARAGISAGDCVAVMVPPSLEFFSLVFGLFKAAVVPVLIDPGLGVRGIGRCLDDAKPVAFIGITKAQLARKLFGWGKSTIRLTVNVGYWRCFCDQTFSDFVSAMEPRKPFAAPAVTADDLAAIVFTSGSTGPAKGAVYTHGNFAAQLELLKTTFGIEPGEMDLCTFPLFALFAPALGMTCVIPDMDFTRPARIDPAKAFAQIQQFEITNLFGSPAVLRKLATAGSVPNKLMSLKRVISAGAAVPAQVIEAFSRLLPDTAEIFTPYGATEALPVACIGSREILTDTRYQTECGRGICVGRPLAGLEVRVIRISDESIPVWNDLLLLPQGEIGEIVVRGPVVTRIYRNRPEATTLAKIQDGDSFWHRMGDVGYFDESGRLWYCGRKSHRVITPTGTLFTEMIEGIFNAVPGVNRTALVGVQRNGVTYPVVCVEYKTPPRTANGVDEQLLRRAESFEMTREIQTFLAHPGFPVDIRHNSKIFREKLAAWADLKLGPKWQPSMPVITQVASTEGSG